MQDSFGFDRWRLSVEDEKLLSNLGFRPIAKNVDLESIDLGLPAISELKDKKCAYFWRMLYNEEMYKIYVGKTNSLPRRLREYSNKFQPGVPNDYKLRHFQTWSRRRLPGSTLDLLAVQRDDHQAIETEVWRKTKPLINERAKVASTNLKNSHFDYYVDVFETKLGSRKTVPSTGPEPSSQSAKSVFLGVNSKSRTNHEMIAEALKGQSGRQIDTQEFIRLIRAAFPTFSEGSLLPNDHAAGNKGACPCAGTERQLLDRIARGQYLVR